MGDTITYGITTPTGYKNSDLGKTWFIKNVDIETKGQAPADSQTLKPTTNSNFRLRYVADVKEGDSTFKVDISVSVGNSGCDTTFTRYFFVSPPPHVAFSGRDTCHDEIVIFTNKSQGAGNNKYQWKFGDNTGSRFMNTGKLYSSPGTYNVTLTATAPSGCKATASQDITIHEIPQSKFSIVNACDSSSVLFYDSSTVTNGQISNYLWEFGGGDTSQRKNPSHIYKTTGTYTVRLTVTSSNGCSHKSGGKAIVHPVPVAAYSGINNCANESVVFSNSSSYAGTDAISYEWDFADGNSSSLENPSHIYSQAGKYSVKLKVKSTLGCEDSSLTSIEVYELPVAGFNTANFCLGDITAFTDNSSIGNGSVASYSWNLGDGTNATMKDTVHEYSSIGKYSVELIVTSNEGCLDSTTKDLEIFPLPKADFTLSNVCQGDEATFNDQSTTTNTLNYQWNFGDGMTSTLKDPTHRFSTSGDFSVQVIITDAEGCKDSVSKQLEAYPLPEAEFTLQNACQDVEVTFDNKSTNPKGSPRYNWEFWRW